MLETFEQLTALHEHLRAQKLDHRSYVTPDYDKMRFRLGTSLAETKIPYVLDTALQSLLKQAADQLVVAIPMRHRGELGPMEVDAILLDPSSERVTLPPAAWYLGDIPKDTIFHRVISRSLVLNRRLDTGLLLWFFGREGIGRQLINELNKYFHKAVTEAKDRGQGEDTLRAALIVLVREWHFYQSTLDERFHHPMLGEAYNAAAVVFHEIVSALLQERFPQAAKMAPGNPEAATYHGAILPLSPLAFAGSRVHFEIDPIGPFGLSAGSIESLEAFFPKMLSRATPLAEVVKQLSQKLAADKKAPEHILSDIRTQRLHEAIVALRTTLKPETDGAEATEAFLAELSSEYGDLLRRILDRKGLKEWQDKAKKVAAGEYKDGLRRFIDAVSALSKLSEGFFSDKQALQSAYQLQVHRFVILRHTEALNAGLIEQAGIFQPFVGDTLKVTEAYDCGQLYRFANDDQIILKAGSAPQEGQLFIDLKDFTKRTFASKELAMADFMKWEFYDPILGAAKKYIVDMAHLDNTNLAINNLMGDAVLASGGVKSLIPFAFEVLLVASEYAEKLRDRMPRLVIDRKVDELTSIYEQEKKMLEAEWSRYIAPARKLTEEIKGLLAADPKRPQLLIQQRGYQEIANAAVRKLKELKTTYEESREYIEGVGLEAGAYIAFGNAAEVVKFKDHVFGNLRVAIGEKINESARGTARDGEVRSHLRYLVDQARAKEKNPEIDYPFGVFVDNTIHPVLEADLGAQLQTAIAKKDVETMKKVVSSFTQRLLNDLTSNAKRETPEYRTLVHGNGIYNLGLAIGKDALEMYLAELAGERTVKRREVKVEALHPEIQRRFVFPKTSYSMAVVDAADEADTEIYVEHGTMVFKGFEKAEPQVIWERLLPKSLFYKLVSKHHLKEWLAEAVSGV